MLKEDRIVSGHLLPEQVLVIAGIGQVVREDQPGVVGTSLPETELSAEPGVRDNRRRAEPREQRSEFLLIVLTVQLERGTGSSVGIRFERTAPKNAQYRAGPCGSRMTMTLRSEVSEAAKAVAKLRPRLTRSLYVTDAELPSGR